MIEVTARGSLQMRGLTAAGARRSWRRRLAALGIEVRQAAAGGGGALAGIDRGRDGGSRGRWRRRSPRGAAALAGGWRRRCRWWWTAAGRCISTRWRRTCGCGAAATAGLVGGRRSAGVGRVVDADDAVAAALDVLARLAALGARARGRDLAAGRRRGAARGGADRPLRADGGGARAASGCPSGRRRRRRWSALAAAAGGGEVRPAPGRALIVSASATRPGSSRRARGLGFVVGPGRSAAGDRRLRRRAGLRVGASRRRGAWPAMRRAGRTCSAGARLHLSGCGKRCAQPAGAGVTLVGGRTARRSRPTAACRCRRGCARFLLERAG